MIDNCGSLGSAVHMLLQNCQNVRILKAELPDRYRRRSASTTLWASTEMGPKIESRRDETVGSLGRGYSPPLREGMFPSPISYGIWEAL